MTQQATDIYATVFKGGTATLMARILGHGGVPIVRADLDAAAYSIYLLDDEDADARSPVEGHEDETIEIDQTVFDALQTGLPWDHDADSQGYNFRHTLDVAAHAAFPIAGRRYLVEYRLTPAAGQAILVRFRINVI